MDLHHAADIGNLEHVRLLMMEQGADKDMGDIRGQTPLFLTTVT